MNDLFSSFCSCRVVQKALETLDESTLPKLLIEFHNHVLSCVHDQNGNHVIQKCIEVVSEKGKKGQNFSVIKLISLSTTCLGMSFPFLVIHMAAESFSGSWNIVLNPRKAGH
jgi:hypothetical protein